MGSMKMRLNEPEFTIVEVPPYKPDKIPDIDHVMECCNNIAEVARELSYVQCSEIFGNLAEIAAALGRDNGKEQPPDRSDECPGEKTQE